MVSASATALIWVDSISHQALHTFNLNYVRIQHLTRIPIQRKSNGNQLNGGKLDTLRYFLEVLKFGLNTKKKPRKMP